MTHSYKITDASVAYDHEQKQDFLEVTVQICLDDEETEVRRFGFPLDTPSKTVRAEMDKLVRMLDTEAESKEKNAESDEKQAKAQETIADLIDNDS